MTFEASIFTMPEEGSAQLEAAREKCTRLFDTWRARLGLEKDASASRSYTLPTGDRVDISSASAVEATAMCTTNEGASWVYQLGANGTLTIPDSDVLATASDYDLVARAFFDAVNIAYAWDETGLDSL